jgi:hypothetical protein
MDEQGNQILPDTCSPLWLAVFKEALAHFRVVVLATTAI